MKSRLDGYQENVKKTDTLAGLRSPGNIALVGMLTRRAVEAEELTITGATGQLRAGSGCSEKPNPLDV